MFVREKLRRLRNKARTELARLELAISSALAGAKTFRNWHLHAPTEKPQSSHSSAAQKASNKLTHWTHKLFTLEHPGLGPSIQRPSSLPEISIVSVDPANKTCNPKIRDPGHPICHLRLGGAYSSVLHLAGIKLVAMATTTARTSSNLLQRRTLLLILRLPLLQTMMMMMLLLPVLTLCPDANAT